MCRSAWQRLGLGLCLAACSKEPGAGSTPPPEPASSAAVVPVTLPPEPAPIAPPAPEPPPAPLVIMVGGDVNFGREAGQAILASPSYTPFGGLAPLWTDADLRFVNLECQLSDQKGETQSPRNRLIFTGPPGGAQVLSGAGIHVVSTANNHAWDYGRSAFFETQRHLAAAGVANVGTGEDLKAALAPARFTLKGKKIAIFAVTHVWNQGPIERHEGRRHVAWAESSAIAGAVRSARGENDVVLVSYHGGAEYVDEPLGGTRKFVRAMMKAGADAVIGHHPHVVQGIGWHAGRPAFYSLGNLVFGPRPEHPWTRFGLLGRLEFDAGGALSAWACPVRIEGHEPSPLAGPEHAALKRYITIATSKIQEGARLGDPDARGCWPITARDP